LKNVLAGFLSPAKIIALFTVIGTHLEDIAPGAAPFSAK
jgi:hypothetical protein